jgi:hypothetical protein
MRFLRPHVTALAVVLIVCAGTPSLAEDVVWATGKVMTSDGRRPLAGAIVAVYDDKNRVVDYAKTDSNGEYTLALNKNVLHLKGKGGGGFLRQVVGVVGGIGRVAAMPLKEGIRAAASIANAADPVTKVGIGAASGVARTLVDTALPPERKKGAVPERALPGAMVMKVSSPGHNDAVSVARVYWMQEEVYRSKGKEQKALTAWVDPAKMSTAGAEKPSIIASDYLTFTEARLEPSIAEPGQTVTISVRLPTPPDPRTPVVVVARNNKTGQYVHLLPGGDGYYHGEIVVDKKFPKNDQTYCVLAYAEQDDRPGRNKKAEDAINGAGLFHAEKPFVYNPLLLVSRNRAELTLTVVEPPKRRR